MHNLLSEDALLVIDVVPFSTLPARRREAGPRPRAWGLWLMLGLVAAAAGSFTVAANALGAGCAQALTLGVVQLAGAVCLGGTCWRSGRPRIEERAQRLAYAESIGACRWAPPLDDGDGVREGLRQVLRERARGLALASYRDGPPAEREWQALALDPRVEDVRFLKAALTLACLEGRRARGAARTRLRQTHRAIWQRVRQLDPGMLAAVRNL